MKFNVWSHYSANKYLPNGQMGKQKVLILCNWILEASLEISNEVIKHRFRKCFLSNNLDRWDEDSSGNFRELKKCIWAGKDLEVKIHVKN